METSESRKEKHKRSFGGFRNTINRKENKWLELQEEYPDKSKTELRKIAPDVYVFYIATIVIGLMNFLLQRKEFKLQINE